MKDIYKGMVDSAINDFERGFASVCNVYDPMDEASAAYMLGFKQGKECMDAASASFRKKLTERQLDLEAIAEAVKDGAVSDGPDVRITINFARVVEARRRLALSDAEEE